MSYNVICTLGASGNPVAIGQGGMPVAAGNYKHLTATANVKATPGALMGVLSSATTAGTIQFYDSATTTTTIPITGVITPAAGSFTPIPLNFTTGLYAVITGTLDATIIYV